MAVKIDYTKCCWENGACKSKGKSNSCSCDCGSSASQNNYSSCCSSSNSGSSCVGCVEICPVEALTRKRRVTVDEEKCTDCGLCIDACKHGAISLD